MTELTRRDVDHVFEHLRKGLVPERGLHAFAVGIDRQREELGRQLDLVAAGEGSIKFLRGGYGCGKTFAARLLMLEARERGFATSFVVVSDNDTRFHRFEELYAKVVAELGTRSCARGALGDILDRWIGDVEEALIATGADEDGPDFDVRVAEKLSEELQAKTQGKAPGDFVRVVQAVFAAKQEGDFAEAGALMSWLGGSRNVAASARKRAGVKGDVTSRDALSYLRGVVEIIKAAGYAGLVIVVDEAETILRSRKDTRHKSLNGLRQIADGAGAFPGLLWVFTGTPDFFDSQRGVKGLPPLHDRIKFIERGGYASVRQPQLTLRPFDDTRLRDVAWKLHKLFPAQDRDILDAKVTREFIGRLVDQVTSGFGGDLKVVPRQFLREFVTVLDLVDQEPEFDPMQSYDFSPDEQDLNPVERAAHLGQPPLVDGQDDGDELVPTLDVW